MSSNRRREPRMGNVCLACGDKGETKLLIYCRNCQDSAVHHYCLDNFSPDDGNIHWFCWDCGPKDTLPLRKSERIDRKRQKLIEARRYWRERLYQNRRLIHSNNGLKETSQLTTVDRSVVTYTKQTDLHSPRDNENESMKIDQRITLTESTPIKSENNLALVDQSEEIRVSNSSRDSKPIDLCAPITTSVTLEAEDSLQHVDSLGIKPVVEPIWRGSFHIEKNLQILAHLSNKAHPKASNAAMAMAPLLDIQILDKGAALSNIFKVSTPTLADIALYFFPAQDRDESAFDALLDEVIQRDLGMRVMINDIELFIFSSRELPLQHWRLCNKYYLWGVFRGKKRRSSLSTLTNTPIDQNHKILGCLETSPSIGKNKHAVHNDVRPLNKTNRKSNEHE